MYRSVVLQGTQTSIGLSTLPSSVHASYLRRHLRLFPVIIPRYQSIELLAVVISTIIRGFSFQASRSECLENRPHPDTLLDRWHQAVLLSI